jgi:hypothetical protein
MTNVKTAISLQDTLFERAEALAREMKVSRSRLFAIAVDELLQRHESRVMLQAINRAWEGEPDAGEAELQRRMRRKHRRSIQGQW